MSALAILITTVLVIAGICISLVIREEIAYREWRRKSEREWEEIDHHSHR
jgi:hypothetical protein